MFQNIKHEKLLFPHDSVVKLSENAKSFISQLLVKDRFKRLGQKTDAP